MLFVAISLSDQAYGMMTLIAIIVDLIMSMAILKKAIQHKQSIVFIFFLTIFFTSVAWWPVAIEYVYWIITGNLLPYASLAELNVLGIVISFLAWLYIYMKVVHHEKPKMMLLILTIYGIFSLSFFIYVIYYVRIAPGAPVKSMIGNEITPFISDAPDIILLYAFILLITVLITGLHFSIRSMRVQDNPEVKWKGRFLFISFILYFFGEMDFMSMFFGIEFAVFTRLILIFSSILFYIGFMMPDFMKKLLNLEEKL